MARELHVNKTEVSRITTAFTRQLSLLLAEAGNVTVGGFGAFRVRAVLRKDIQLTQGTFKKGGRGKLRKMGTHRCLLVHFSKSARLKELLQVAYKE